ncbi:MAG: hypothetical protein CME06_07530 [Gemmatimonadetes bacterium]|nr:hypothetical protein [Gemmatimonadota bacterium]
MDGDESRIETLLRDGYRIDLNRIFSEAWRVFVANPGGFSVFTLIAAAASVVAWLTFSIVPVLGTILAGALLTPLYAGFFLVAFRFLDGGSYEFMDFFKGYEQFTPIFLLGLISNALTTVGYFLLIVPGIYLNVAWIFGLPLLLTGRGDFWSALTMSMKVVNRGFISVFGLAMLLMIMNVAGAMLLGVGLLLTVPLSACAIAVAYRDVFGS